MKISNLLTNDKERGALHTEDIEIISKNYNKIFKTEIRNSHPDIGGIRTPNSDGQVSPL